MAEGTSFSVWKYNHYFSILETRDTNITVKCNLCEGNKTLSMARRSNANLLKHLQRVHASTKLVAKDPPASGSENTGDGDPGGATPAKHPRLHFEKAQSVSRSQLNRLIARYVVDDMLPISTVESAAFRGLVSKIPVKGQQGLPCRKTFSKYLNNEYAKIETELKQRFEEIEYLSTTADIWTVHNKSFLGVTAHWIDPHT